MKTKKNLILMLSILLFYGCSSSHTSVPSYKCDTGKVVFTRYNDANNIYILDLKSRKQSVLYNDSTATGIGGIAWSPDGFSISFLRYSGDNSDIYILPLNTSKPEQVTNTPNIELSPSWSPDGKYILTTSVIGKYGQLLKITVNDSNIDQLTNENWNFQQASWSPDGKKIVYVSDQDRMLGIYTMNSDGNEQRLLSKDVFGYIPKWSPNGKYIIFNSKSLSVKTRLVLYNIQDQTFSLLIPGDTGDSNEIGYSFGSAMWSKNGQCVMYIKGEGENEFLYIMNFASRETTELVDVGLVDSIDWYSE